MLVSTNSIPSSAECNSWQQQIQQCLAQGNYIQAANLCEQAINAEPDVKSHYWHLGLMLLLQGKEEEAHTTWLLGMVEGEPEEVEQWTAELVAVLEAEAQKRAAQEDASTAWLIRQHLREIQPANINNLLRLIQVSIQIEKFSGDNLTEWGVIELLKAALPVEVDADLLMQALESVLEAEPLHPSSLDLVEASLAHVRDTEALLRIIVLASMKIAYSLRRPEIAARLAELYRRLAPEQPEILRHLAAFYQNAGQNKEGVEIAKLCYSIVEDLADKIFANHMILRGLMNGAAAQWEEASEIFQKHESLLRSLVEQAPKLLNQATITRLFSSAQFFAPYIYDQPARTKSLRNQVVKLCQENVQNNNREKVERYLQRHSERRGGNVTKPIKIGYLSSCLRRHSVGWLARGVFKYHDREKFQIYAYCVNYKKLSDPLHEWYVSNVFKTYYSLNALEIAEEIYKDEIDILIDLDSMTLDISCETMAMKAAPVQVTWLGWDSSGIPAIDYFIADPYVLPESAQDYYTEKIWRLPETYIAVDGFEVGVPNIRRDSLEIPSDAVVYYCGQNAWKRHPDFTRLQMRVLKEVPNSYLLIKGLGNQETIQNFFIQLAEEEGIKGERLRFLPLVPTEDVHRANLSIVDVVLDTYPYNGATTTMETLWMGIPLVTRVGEQFAARNSYTMMMNAGVTEGIAWTDEEYLEWAIRLGKEPELRKQIAWKLRLSRRTSPLWNAKKFTREIEKAYEQMWQRFLENQ